MNAFDYGLGVGHFMIVRCLNTSTRIGSSGSTPGATRRFRCPFA